MISTKNCSGARFTTEKLFENSLIIRFLSGIFGHSFSGHEESIDRRASFVTYKGTILLFIFRLIFANLRICE